MLKKVVKWVAALLLLAVVAVLGYFYYQHHARNMVAQLAQQFEAVAKVDYGDVQVDFEGRITVYGIQVSPHNYQDSFIVEELQLQAGDALSLLGSGRWFKGTLPANLNVSISGISFSTGSDFLSLTKAASDTSDKSLWGQACGDDLSAAQLLKKLNYTNFTLNADLAMNGTPDGRQLSTQLSLKSLGLAKIGFKLVIENPQLADLFEKNVLAQTKVRSALFEISDLGFNNKRIKYCAKEENIPAKDYQKFFDAHMIVNVLDEAISDANVLSQSVLAFFNPGVNVALSLEPKQNLLLSNLLQADYDYLSSRGLALAVNHKRVSARYFPLVYDFNIDAGQSADAQAASLEAIKQQVMAPKPKPVKPSFKEIPLERLGQFSGVMVKLRTKVGKEMDGQLLEVRAQSIVVRRRVEQGFVVYPVNVSDIASIKSFR